MASRTETRTRAAAKTKSSPALSSEERAAMKELVKERKAQARGEDGEAAVLEKIAEMPDADREMAERLHAIVKKRAPALTARTWYGMPAYAKDGKVLLFFQSASKFKARYATIGFTDKADLDDGNMWPTSFALKRMTAAVEKSIADLLTRAAG